eukprot:comp19976_c0_seq1/m.24381 comp19976_c0_seq1/g.24381  ORF comp19976_c0_seq1/g.24381 comp19976_c0_seq1/m.24381 type:complete len:102 (-) comp19976_c0_seq1:963-1268(-)
MDRPSHPPPSPTPSEDEDFVVFQRPISPRPTLSSSQSDYLDSGPKEFMAQYVANLLNADRFIQAAERHTCRQRRGDNTLCCACLPVGGWWGRRCSTGSCMQ